MQVMLNIKNINGLYEILKDLNDQGLKVNEDFEFAYAPGGWSMEMGSWNPTLSLSFKNPSIQAWVLLKYT